MENQKVSGKEESSTLSRLKEFEKELNDHITGLGLGNLAYDAEADKALSFTMEQLKGLATDECGEYAYKLQQFALFIQQRYNRAKSIKRWAEHNLSVVVAKEGSNYGSQYTKYEERRWLVVAGNSYAKSLSDISLNAMTKLEELEFVASRINAVAQTLMEIQQHKRQRR